MQWKLRKADGKKQDFRDLHATGGSKFPGKPVLSSFSLEY
jgi:hypothetical protein